MNHKKLLFLIVIPLFLSLAISNVKASPDVFGKTDKGPQSLATAGDVIKGSWFTCPKEGQALSISLYLKQHTSYLPKIKCAIYALSTLYPTTLIGYTQEWTLTSGWDNWKTFNIVTGGSLQTNTKYWLVFWTDNLTYVYVTPYSGDRTIIGPTTNYDGFPNPFPDGGNYNDKLISIYCTYEPTEEEEYEQEESEKKDLTIYTIPDNLGYKLGLGLFTSKLICSTILLLIALLPTAIIFRKRGDSMLIEIIVGFCVMGICLSLGWLPVWIVLILSLLIGLLFLPKLTAIRKN